MNNDPLSFDPLAEERVSPTTSVERHESGDPMIVPRGETEAIRYTRASSLSDFLAKDIFGIAKWEKRYLAQALGRNLDLAMWAGSLHYSTGPITGTLPISERQRAGKQLDEICEMALERERIHEAANVGSVFHELTVPGNTAPVPGALADAVNGYRCLTAGLERVASEVFVVCDELRAAGTFDSGYLDPDLPGCVIVGDTKSGKNYHQGQFEIQLATYARGEVYQSDGGRLTFEEFFGVPVNLDVGYLVHVPVGGSPKPRIVELDLQRGWRLAQSAARTRDDRNELDKIGIGPKVKHADKAQRELARLFGELPDDNSPEIFRAKALALRERFLDYWTDELTDEVKRRLS